MFRYFFLPSFGDTLDAATRVFHLLTTRNNGREPRRRRLIDFKRQVEAVSESPNKLPLRFNVTLGFLMALWLLGYLAPLYLLPLRL